MIYSNQAYYRREIHGRFEMQMKSMVKCFVLAMVALISFSVFAGTIFISPGQYTYSRKYPINIFYNYARCQMLYLQDEIDCAGEIKAIRFYQTNSVDATIDNCTIYMYETDCSSISNWYGENPNGPGTLVFSGSLTSLNASDAPGWFEIELGTPFDYSNDNNLLISFRHQDGEWENFPKWRVSNAVYRCVEGGDDNDNPPDVSGCLLPDIQLEIYVVPNVNFKLWDNEPDPDPDESETDASGIDLTSVVVKLNGVIIDSGRFTVSDVSSGSNHGKRFEWMILDSDNLVSGTNTVEVRAKDIAGNLLQPHPWTFTFQH
jgi:hypothetical protein